MRRPASGIADMPLEVDFTPEPTCIAQWCVNSDRPNPADFYVIGTAHAGHMWRLVGMPA